MNEDIKELVDELTRQQEIYYGYDGNRNYIEGYMDGLQYAKKEIEIKLLSKEIK